jgi:antiviral helicase SLH1
MYAPRFPKLQTEGWFVVLCVEDKDEIVAIKRLGWSTSDVSKGQNRNQGGRVSARTMMKLPTEEDGTLKDGRKVDIWVVSDGYLGMVYKIRGLEIPDAPKIVDDGKKDKPGDGKELGGSSAKMAG